MVALLALGKISRKLPAFPPNTPQVLNQFVIWISFPATVLLKVNGLKFDLGLLTLVAVPWALVCLSLVMVLGISRVLGWDRKLTGGVLLTVALGNTSFYGFPAVTAFLGEEYLALAILYDQLGSFLALAIFGTIVVSVFQGDSQVSFASVAKKIVGFPPIIALCVGLLTSGLVFPHAVTFILQGLSATLIPLVMVSVGAQLRFRQPASNLSPIFIILGLKMAVSPLLVMAVLLGLGISGPVFQVSVFEAAMPPMVLAGVLASTGGLRGDVANAAIGYGIILSFVTLPLIYYLIQLQ